MVSVRVKNEMSNNSIYAGVGGSLNLRNYKSGEFKMTHQATANTWSLSAHMVSGVIACFCFFGWTGTMCENNDHILIRKWPGGSNTVTVNSLSLNFSSVSANQRKGQKIMKRIADGTNSKNINESLHDSLTFWN